MWLRELDEPLFTFQMYSAFVAAGSIQELDARLHCIARGIESLPLGNRTILRRTFSFLKKVASNHAVNKMTGMDPLLVPELLQPAIWQSYSLLACCGRMETL